jgi:hypothetical protein
MRGLSRVVSRSLPLLLSAAFPAASFAVQTGVAAQAEMTNVAPADTFVVAVQDTSKVVPGARYRAGWIKPWLLGHHYRALWATGLDVPVLDLERTGGGLTAKRRTGGKETRGLRFQAADGRTFVFRSLDKDPTPMLTPDLRGTVVQDLVQDQISAAHPAGPLVAFAVMHAVGVPGGSPALVTLPASDRLGAFREEFAGMLGYIEVRAEDGTPLGPGQPTFTDVVNTEQMMARLRKHPGESVDARRYLTARLVDFFLGDWDRHRGQWRWGRRTRDAAWEPIPTDRDQALARYDGLMLSLARQRSAPQLTNFGGSIPVGGLTWNGRDIDRLILPRLGPSAWDSVTGYVVARLDDAALESIVGVVPARYGKGHRQWLREKLARRRADLAEASAQFRRQIKRTPELLLTDAPERIELASSANDGLRVIVHPVGSGQPAFEHTFTPDETREVRIYALGGADSVWVQGRHSRIRARFVGGAGPDRLVGGSAAWLMFVEGGATWREAPEEETPPPPQDWGSRTQHLPVLGFAGDQGLVAGYWVRRTHYGFRRFPHASSWEARGMMGPSTGRPGFYFDADMQSRDSAWFLGLAAHATGAERMRWYGVGNETAELDDQDLHLVDNWQLKLEPTFNLRLHRRLVLGAGPTVRFTRTTAEPGRELTIDQPFGSGDFGQTGAVAYLRWEPSARGRDSRSGVSAEIGGRVMPAIWDVDSTYGAAHAAVGAQLAGGGSLQPSLSLRLRGEHIFGTAPFFDLATIGGAGSLRGYSQQRFRGDGSLVANTEARIRLAHAELVLPADIGVMGIGDVGRVFLDDESSDVWHGAAGGGLWISWLDGDGSLAISVVAGSEHTMLYVGTALSY